MSYTGGVDLGPVGGIQAGQVPIFHTLTRHLARLPEYGEFAQQARQAGKDFNDGPVGWTVGSSAGKRVVDAGISAL